jgi:hypothetical protein
MILKYLIGDASVILQEEYKSRLHTSYSQEKV